MRKLSLIIVLAFVFMSVAMVSPTPSPHGDDFKISCDVCHSSKGWKLDKEIYSFDHNTTALPLTGQHKQVDCKSCHPTLVFKDAKTSCVDCHTDMHNQTVGPDCSRCHTTNSWIVENTTEMHQRSRFPLTGPHYATDCGNCHKSASLLRFEPLGVECYDCHSANYNSTTQPNHVQGNYSKNCIECHSLTSMTWSSSNIDHSFFPLTGGHAIGDCYKCHTNGTFNGLSKECVTCHLTTYNNTNNPNHANAGFSTNCAQCHTTAAGWSPATFDHSKFPLTLGHAVSPCTKCHINGTYPNTPTACVACHQTTYNATTNPNHTTAQFSTDCQQCHTTNPGWTPANYDHNIFPLTSGHAVSPCTKCHPNNIYTNTPNQCVGCHLTNYNATTNPNHITINLPTTCADCHTTNPGWKPAQFAIHDAQFFPIYSGKHNNTWTQCTECHPNTSNYAQFTCIDCHDHNKTDMDNKHNGVGGYAYNSPACYSCHPTGSGQGGFNHNNGFPLTGAHLTTPCSSCHINGYAGTSTVCSDCHISNYNQTTNPNHTAIGIANTCNTCHTTNPGWKPATFPTHGNYYQLTGAHATIANNCVACHNGNYSQTPNTCVGCHQTNYNQTTNPVHTAAGIATTCANCHTTNPGWSPATYPVHNNLIGYHLTLASNCNACHSSGYTNTPTLCIGCHQNDYNNTNNPPHASAQFPTTCADCHTQSVWVPSTFNHDGQYFPIYSGKHNGKWTLCSDCHTNSSNYSVFSCIDCHTHSQATTNNQHSGVPGYSYNSLACYQCHPTGNAGKMIKIIDPQRKE